MEEEQKEDEKSQERQGTEEKRNENGGDRADSPAYSRYQLAGFVIDAMMRTAAHESKHIHTRARNIYTPDGVSGDSIALKIPASDND